MGHITPSHCEPAYPGIWVWRFLDWLKRGCAGRLGPSGTAGSNRRQWLYRSVPQPRRNWSIALFIRLRWGVPQSDAVRQVRTGIHRLVARKLFVHIRRGQCMRGRAFDERYVPISGLRDPHHIVVDTSQECVNSSAEGWLPTRHVRTEFSCNLTVMPVVFTFFTDVRKASRCKGNAPLHIER